MEATERQKTWLHFIVFFTNIFIFGTLMAVVRIFLFYYLRELGASDLLCGLSLFVQIIPEVFLFDKMDYVYQKLGDLIFCVACFVRNLKATKKTGVKLMLLIANVCFSVRVWFYTVLKIYAP